MTNASNTNISKYRYLWLLLLLSAFIGFFGIDKSPLDGDEVVTANIATGFGFVRNSIHDGFRIYPKTEQTVFSSAEYWQRNQTARTVKYTIDDCGHSLTYNVLMHYWINETGFSVAALRWPSAILVLLSTLLFYHFIIKTFQDRRVANLSTLFFVLHALVIQISHFARMYAFALVLLLLIMVLCKGLETSVKESRSWHGFWQALTIGLLAGLAVVTHYFTGLAMAGVFFFYAFQVNRQNLRRAIAIAINIFLPFAVVLFVYLFPLGAMKSIQSIMALNKAAEDPSQHFFGFEIASFSSVIWSFLCRITTSFGNSTASEWDTKSIANVCLMLFPLLIIGLNLKAAFRKYGKKDLVFLIWGMVTYIILAAVVILLTKNMVIMHARYWIFCLPFSLPLLAVCISAGWQERKSVRWIITAAALAVILLRMSYTLVMYVRDVQSTWNGDPRERMAHQFILEYKSGDTISYKDWWYSQQENWFLKDYPQFVQRVDTLQSAKIILLSGGKQHVVSQ
ncbi:glycosyltransferase family 39 protein [Taibaiella soli]|uniref:ArnT-like N-terminal domain-containing protein n=1 Tax=Taibaiella soli TaxID=1649169 RepID=A0A2W2BG41_9BACT|nr:phospholipid carrier-dependent glycosyltransferase [Taibaiella soli]PZF72456.1 hypothetical protein DN068_13990 [Taibaiella soli]